MKNLKLFCIVLLSSSMVFSSCNNCLKGEGDPMVELLELPDFSAINITGSVGVNLQQGMEQRVEVTGPANIIALLKRSIQNNTWEVGFEECINSKNFQINITVPNLSSITVSGSGDVIGLSNFNVENMEINVLGSGNVELLLNSQVVTAIVNGSGSIKLNGSATNLTAKVSGSGDFMGGDFTTVRSKIDVKGSGDASINASELYDISISGSGDVEYKETEARIISDIRGSGEITRK